MTKRAKEGRQGASLCGRIARVHSPSAEAKFRVNKGMKEKGNTSLTIEEGGNANKKVASSRELLVIGRGNRDEFKEPTA